MPRPTIQDQTVGYLDRESARSFRERMAEIGLTPAAAKDCANRNPQLNAHALIGDVLVDQIARIHTHVVGGCLDAWLVLIDGLRVEEEEDGEV